MWKSCKIKPDWYTVYTSPRWNSLSRPGYYHKTDSPFSFLVFSNIKSIFECNSSSRIFVHSWEDSYSCLPPVNDLKEWEFYEQLYS